VLPHLHVQTALQVNILQIQGLLPVLLALQANTHQLSEHPQYQRVKLVLLANILQIQGLLPVLLALQVNTHQPLEHLQ